MKRQSPFTTCYCCNRTRERDYTTLFNMSTEVHPYLIDICDLCLETAKNKGLRLAIQEAHDSIRIERDDGGKCCTECFSVSHDVNDVAVPDACADDQCDCHITFTDGSKAIVVDGLIRDVVEAK